MRFEIYGYLTACVHMQAHTCNSMLISRIVDKNHNSTVMLASFSNYNSPGGTVDI